VADRLPERILTWLREARESALLERASFGSDTPVRVFFGTSETAKQWPNITEMVKELVKIHHASWIVGPIDEVLKWSASTNDGSQKEYTLLGRLRAPLPNPAVLEEAAQEIERLSQRDRILSQMLRDFERDAEKAKDRLKGMQE
jgi:hypothetical protein